MENSKKVNHLPALDGIRGFAAILVLLSHASLGGMMFLPGLDFGGVGKYGVFVFFVLSAFLLSLQFLRSEREHLTQPSFFIHYFNRTDEGLPYFDTPLSILSSALMIDAPGYFGRSRWSISSILSCRFSPF